MARFVTMPAPSAGLPPQITFGVWLGWYCDSEPRLQKPHTAARAAQRMLEAVDKAQGATVELRDDDHERLTKLLLDEQEPPACGLAPTITAQLANGQSQTTELPARLVLPYIDAIANATSERPA